MLKVLSNLNDSGGGGDEEDLQFLIINIYWMHKELTGKKYWKIY